MATGNPGGQAAEAGEIEPEFEEYRPALEKWTDERAEVTTRRMDTVRRLEKEGAISPKQKIAAQNYRAVIETYFVVASGMAKLSEESVIVGGDGDPIRLYAKGRRTYRATQKPRNVSRPKTSFDGWSVDRSNALKMMHRLRIVLAGIDPAARKALYALVLSPDAHDRRPTSLSAYCVKCFGSRNMPRMAEIVSDLQRALTELVREGVDLWNQEIEFEEAA